MNKKLLTLVATVLFTATTLMCGVAGMASGYKEKSQTEHVSRVIEGASEIMTLGRHSYLRFTIQVPPSPVYILELLDRFERTYRVEVTGWRFEESEGGRWEKMYTTGMYLDHDRPLSH